MKIKPGKNAKGRGLSEHLAYYIGPRHARVAGVRGVRRRAVSAVARLVPRHPRARRRPAPGGDRGAADRAAGVQDRGARAHRGAPAHAAPRSGVRRRAGPAAADDGLPAAGVFGRRRLGGLPAGVRGGQLPGDVSPAGRRAAAGGGGDRLRGRDLLRPGRAARGAPGCSRATPDSSPCSRCSTSCSCTRRWPASAASTCAASTTRSRRCARRRATSA